MTYDIFTKVGAKELNEDFAKIEVIKDLTVAVLADGMGGLSLGDKASEVVTDAIITYAKDHYSMPANMMLQEAFNDADLQITTESILTRTNMGAAVASVVITDGICFYAWQGNVRIYLCRNKTLSQLTKDHVRNVGYGRTCLTRCIKGGGLREDVKVLSLPVISGDIIILSTDGFYKEHESLLATANSEQMEAICSDIEDDATVVRVYIA